MQKMSMLQKVFLYVGTLLISAFAQQFTEVTGWVMQDSSKVSEKTGELISATSYSPTGWYKATVPGTVLSTLVDQGDPQFKDIYLGTNMSTMPDIAAQQRRYWFRTTFKVAFTEGMRVWLEMEGINYKAFIYVNGKSVGSMYGAFKGGKFDVTSMVTSGVNALAVKIVGNVHPGVYHTKKLHDTCGSSGGEMTGDGPTFIASQSWDWMPTIPDRDMGIWKPVYVRVTGAVALRDPWIKTTNVSTASATVPLQVTLLNATTSAVTGTANAAINGSTQFEPQTVTIPAMGSTIATFSPLTINSPKLWMPNGYGDPNLYTCTISFTPEGGTVSDTNSFQFGVRQWSYALNNSVLTISCNGQRILIKGGNWGMDDAMKRWDIHKTENKVRYHKEMNFNMIRDWLGQTDNEPFYHYCDKYGIIVWADFWQAYGPADGPEPYDLELYKNNMIAKMLRLRNHASIAIWNARNETEPNTALLTYLQTIYDANDNTRRVLASSGTFGNSGVHSGGPYSWTPLQDVYSKITGFHTEFGSQAMPSYESFNEFMPADKQWPINSVWSYHDYCEGNQYPHEYTAAANTIYGASSNVKDFIVKAQLLNYDEYRAAFETVQAKRFSTSNGVTGLLLWMSSSSWPSLVWQTYDYYMEGTGAMYGCMKGSEPVHIMYHGTGAYQVSVVNNTSQALSGYTAKATTYNLTGAQTWTNVTSVDVRADNAVNAFPITTSTSPYFLDLKLTDSKGNLVSKNFYCLPNNGTNISGIIGMAKTVLSQTADAVWTKTGVENTVKVKIVNTGSVCAVSCRLLLTRATSGKRVLPVHYNDNYFSLAPKDTQDVTIQFDDVDVAGELPKLALTGVNVVQTNVVIGGTGFSRRTVDSDSKDGRLYMSYTGTMLRIHGITNKTLWQARIIDMQGRIVLTKQGVGVANLGTVSVANVPAGVYVATIFTDNKKLRAMIAVAGNKK